MTLFVPDDHSPVPSGVASQSSAAGRSVVSRAGEYLRVEGLIQGTGLLVAGVPWIKAAGDSLLASGESSSVECWDPPSPPWFEVTWNWTVDWPAAERFLELDFRADFIGSAGAVDSLIPPDASSKWGSRSMGLPGAKETALLTLTLFLGFELRRWAQDGP